MVFDCFGCISLGIKENFSIYLDDTMKMIALAFEGSIKLSKSVILFQLILINF